jgi:hypothetical protein
MTAWMEYAGKAPFFGQKVYRVGPRTVSTTGKLAVGTAGVVVAEGEQGALKITRLVCVHLFADTVFQVDEGGAFFPEPNAEGK